MLLPFYGNYFAGEFNQPSTSGLGRVDLFTQKYSPADLDSELWNIPVEYRHISEALTSLDVGFENLEQTLLTERIIIINNLVTILEKNINNLAHALTLETGRPHWDCLEEVSSAVSNIPNIIGHTKKFINTITTNKDEQFFFKPLGPALVIGSFSEPFALPLEQICYLFLAGNSILFKPSQEVLHTAQLLFNSFHEASFPAGSLNLLLGDSQMSTRILQTKKIKNIFFSGTTDHGKELATLLKTDLTTKLNLQLSTKNSCIIDQHADISAIVPSLIKSSLQATGQFSSRTALVFAHADIIEQLIDQTHALAKKLIIDHPSDFTDEPFMGPLISENSLESYLQYMGMAKREGAIEIMRGKKLESDKNGYYVTPSIHYFEELQDFGHFIKTEHLFPNITFVKYSDLNIAIEQINSLPYGLCCSLFINDQKSQSLCIKKLEVGIIMKNSFMSHHQRCYRYGGDKDSSNFSNVGTAMFEAGLKRVSIKENNQLEKISTIIGIKKEE